MADAMTDPTAGESFNPAAGGGFNQFGTIGAGVGAIAGMGLSAYGAYESMQGAKEVSSASKAIAGFEIQQDKVRKQLMEVTSRRESMQALRNMQQAKAAGLTSASGKGAQFGSGYAGGQAQITSQGNTMQTGIAQNLAAGEKMFALNDQINQQKMLMSAGQSQEATGAGFSSLGGSLSGSLSAIGNLAGLLVL